MGLVARVLERAGIPTATLTVLRSMTDGLAAPRNVLVRFRLGQVFGPPGDAERQRAVLREALSAIGTITQPGATVELPFRWRR